VVCQGAYLIGGLLFAIIAVTTRMPASSNGELPPLLTAEYALVVVFLGATIGQLVVLALARHLRDRERMEYVRRALALSQPDLLAVFELLQHDQRRAERRALRQYLLLNGAFFLLGLGAGFWLNRLY
jgi:hypothetical protein